MAGAPGAFLIRPIHNLDRRKRLVTRVMQCSECFKRAEHPKRFVKLSPRWLGVEVATHGNRGQIRPLTWTACEHRTHIVDRNYAAQFFSPCLEPVAHLSIEISQRKPANATLRSAADRCCLPLNGTEPLGSICLFDGSCYRPHLESTSCSRACSITFRPKSSFGSSSVAGA